MASRQTPIAVFDNNKGGLFWLFCRSMTDQQLVRLHSHDPKEGKIGIILLFKPIRPAYIRQWLLTSQEPSQTH